MKLPNAAWYTWVLAAVILFFLLALNSGIGVVNYIIDSPESILGCLLVTGVIWLGYGWVRKRVDPTGGA